MRPGSFKSPEKLRQFVAHPVAHLDCSVRKMKEPQASDLGFFVELRRIELLTSSMPLPHGAVEAADVRRRASSGCGDAGPIRGDQNGDSSGTLAP